MNADWPVPLPQHLSATSLNMMSRCPEQFRRRYVLGEKAKPSVHLVWGGADHAAIETSMRQKIETFEDLPMEDVLDAFSDAFTQKVEEAGGEFEIDWAGKRIGEVKDLGSRMVAAYHSGVSPKVQPVNVEEEIRFTPIGWPVEILGYVDLETKLSVIDRKTSGQKMYRPKPEHRLQGSIYQAFKRKQMDWHVSVKTKVPYVQTSQTDSELLVPYNQLVVERDLARMLHLLERISGYLEKFGPDHSWPTEAPNTGYRDDVCGLCGWGPNGNNTCQWMKGRGRPDLRVVA